MVCISGTLNLQPFTSRGPNIVAQIVLLVVFLSFFGMPAIERFLKKDVIIVETLKKTDGIPTPAITISVPKQPRNHSCFNKNVSIEDCLEKNYLKQSDIIKNVIMGSTLRKQVNLTSEIVREDFSGLYAGIYFTLSLPFKIGTDMRKDILFIGLKANLSYLVFIHDPRYFLFTDNPKAIPGEIRNFYTNEMTPSSWQYRLELVEVNKLNLPTSPCNEDPSYSFSSCVRNRIGSKVKRRRSSKDE